MSATSEKIVVVNKAQSAGILIEPTNSLAGFLVTMQTKSPITEEYTTAIAEFSYSELQELKAAIDKAVAL